MSTEVVRELLMNVKNTFNDRLNVIEDILSKTKTMTSDSSVDMSAVNTKIGELEGHFRSLDEYTMGQIRTLTFNHDQLETRVLGIETMVRNIGTNFATLSNTIGSLVKRMDDERPVEAAEVEVEIEETQNAALKEPEVQEEEEEAEAEADDEAEEEAEAEEEDNPYEHIFSFKGSDYFEYKETHNVYIADEDGGIDENDVKGVWNPVSQKMYDLDKKKWWDPKTDKYTDPKPKK